MLWIKMYPAKCLRGSLHFDLPLSKRSIWYELLLMAGDLDNDGIIDYPIQFIVSQLGCLRKTLDEVLAILEKTDRIKRNGNEIVILNWFKYQSPNTKKGAVPKQRTSRAVDETEAFKEYLDELRPQYPHLDIDAEWAECKKWWKKEGRIMKDPKRVIKNWLKKDFKSGESKQPEVESSDYQQGMTPL